MSQPTAFLDTGEWENQPEQAGGGGWRRLRFVVGGLVVLLAIGYLVATNLQQTGVYYLTIGEYAAKPASYAGRDLRLAGTVASGTIERDSKAGTIRFGATEGGATLPISYRGVVPDIFGDGVDVVVEGKVRSDGVFEAHTLLAKCPSKFEAKLHDSAAPADAPVGK